MIKTILKWFLIIIGVGIIVVFGLYLADERPRGDIQLLGAITLVVLGVICLGIASLISATGKSEKKQVKHQLDIIDRFNKIESHLYAKKEPGATPATGQSENSTVNGRSTDTDSGSV